MEKRLIKSNKYDLKYDYFVFENGKIYSSRTNHFLSTHLDKYGYEKVRLVSLDGRHTYSVHRLVLENFYPVDNMEELQVNHIDGNKLNNNLKNLEWTTPSENVKHAFSIGLKTQKGEANNMNKYSEETIKQVIKLLKNKKYSGAEIDRMFGFCDDYANSIRRKERWKYLTQDIDFD